LDLILNNIQLPTTDAGWQELSDRWSELQLKRRGFDLMPGTVLAGDGIVPSSTIYVWIAG
jgi:hypothetical protein